MSGYEHKCVFFLGAGFSKDAGVPLQSELLPTYLFNQDNDEGGKKEILGFLKEVFSFDYTRPTSIGDNGGQNIYPTLEDVFSLLDNAIMDNEYIGDFDPSELVDIKNHFVSGIASTIDQSIEDPIDCSYIGKFARLLTDQRIESDADDPFSIITTNWDIVLLNKFRQYHDMIIRGIIKEHSDVKSLSEISKSNKIDRRKIALLDYCIYNHTLRDDKNHIPSFKIKSMGYKNIKLLNLHGCPTWLICQKCKRIFSHPTYDKHGRYMKDALPYMDGKPAPCPICKTHDKNTLLPILIMPTYLKVIQNVHLLDVWQNSAVELQEADSIFFIGYSLPEADYLIRHLSVSNIRKDAEIFVSSMRDSVPQTLKNYKKLFGSQIKEKNLLVGSGKEVVECICKQIENGEIKCFQS